METSFTSTISFLIEYIERIYDCMGYPLNTIAAILSIFGWITSFMVIALVSINTGLWLFVITFVVGSIAAIRTDLQNIAKEE